MPELSRKLLLIRRDDGQGWNLMLELDNRTMSRQVDDALGDRLMAGCIDTITGILVQSGMVTPHMFEADRPRKKRR